MLKKWIILSIAPFCFSDYKQKKSKKKKVYKYKMWGFFFSRRTVAIDRCRGTCNSPCYTMMSWIDIWRRVSYKTHFRGAYLSEFFFFLVVNVHTCSSFCSLSSCKATNSLQAFHVFLKFKENTFCDGIVMRREKS